jgi:hypothetical protein
VQETQGGSEQGSEREVIVAALVRRAADDLGPDQAAKNRMRARVLDNWDAHPRSETTDPLSGRVRTTDRNTPRPGRHALRPRKSHAMPSTGGPGRKPRFGVRGRALLAVAGAVCLLLSLSGMGMLLSRDAVPGDTLYGLKRTAENASLNLAFDEHDYTVRHLEVADTRLGEVEALAGRRDQDRLDAYYRNSFGGFDQHLKEASRLISRQAAAGDFELVSKLRVWTDEQGRRLELLQRKLPAGVREDATSELRTLGAIYQRADALTARRLCKQVVTGTTDELGPIPSNQPCDGKPPLTEQRTLEAPKTTPPPTSPPPSRSHPMGDVLSNFVPQPPWLPAAPGERRVGDNQTSRSTNGFHSEW